MVSDVSSVASFEAGVAGNPMGLIPRLYLVPWCGRYRSLFPAADATPTTRSGLLVNVDRVEIRDAERPLDKVEVRGPRCVAAERTLHYGQILVSLAADRTSDHRVRLLCGDTQECRELLDLGGPSSA